MPVTTATPIRTVFRWTGSTFSADEIRWREVDSAGQRVSRKSPYSMQETQPSTSVPSSAIWRSRM